MDSVGVDVSKGKSTVCFLTDCGEVLYKHLKYPILSETFPI